MECSGDLIETEELYESLWDTPCLVCEKSEAFVLGSFIPKSKQWFRRKKETPALCYTLCKQCFNHGHLPTEKIVSAYSRTFR